MSNAKEVIDAEKVHGKYRKNSDSLSDDITNQKQRKILVIAGMHRSGTSATSGVCEILGCTVPGEVVPAADDNPRGFFENRRFVEFNDSLLARLGSAYDDPNFISASDIRAAIELGAVDTLGALLEVELRLTQFPVIKDPRICRLLPIWKAALERIGYEILIAHPIRHPIEVASSLQKRNSFSQTQGLLLWLDHVLSSEMYSRDKRRSFFKYDELMADWRTVALKIAADLKFSWPHSPHRVEDQVDGFLASELRHHRAEASSFSLDSPLHVLCSRVWEACNGLVQSASHGSAVREFEDVRNIFQDSQAIYAGYVASTQRSMAERSREVEALNRHSAHMEHMLSNANAIAESQRVQITSLESDVEQATENIQSRDERVLELQDDVAKTGEQFTDLQLRHHEREDTIEALKVELGQVRISLKEVCDESISAEKEFTYQQASREKAESKIAQALFGRHERDLQILQITLDAGNQKRSFEELGKRLQIELEYRGHLEALVASTQAHMNTLYGSASWRLSAPVRVIGRRMPRAVRKIISSLLLGVANAKIRPKSDTRSDLVSGQLEPPLPIDREEQTSLPAEPASQRLGADLTGSNSSSMEAGSDGDLSKTSETPVAVPFDQDQLVIYADQQHAAELIRSSGLFDPDYYSGSNEAKATGVDPVIHYLVTGEKEGRKPSRDFDPLYYAERYDDVARADVNLLLHYVSEGRREGRIPIPIIARISLPGSFKYFEEPDLYDERRQPTEVAVAVPYDKDQLAIHADQQHAAKLIRASGLFDPDSYGGIDEANAAGLDPVIHYIIAGEREGRQPSSKFDPLYYAERYTDVGVADVGLLLHYISDGQREGRKPIPAAARMSYPENILESKRKTVLLIVHESSRTGAPILAWNLVIKLRQKYNVIVLLMQGGEFTSVFEQDADILLGPVGAPDCWDGLEARFIVKEIVGRYSINFVIANSVETRNFAVELAKHTVPVVTLVHEFATYYRPHGMLHDLFQWSSRVVFPAGLVRSVAELEYDVLRGRGSEILPQGRSLVPQAPADERRTSFDGKDVVRGAAKDPGGVEGVLAKLRPKGYQDAFLVLGMGTVQQRKGVDLFIAAAAAAKRLAPDRLFRFIWIGHGYEPEVDLNYSVYLHAQIQHSGLVDDLEIIDNVSDPNVVYAEMDALMLSSRLDPLPNVSIDAALQGIPVVCFDNASGFAEILAENHVLKQLVVPHLDSSSAGMVLSKLATDKRFLSKATKEIKRLAEGVFVMDSYVDSLASIGVAAAEELRLMAEDRAFIQASAAFDTEFYAGESGRQLTQDEALDQYLIRCRNYEQQSKPAPYAYTRRPLPGFNPHRFREEHSNGEQRAVHRDPFAEYLRMGRPEGPWVHPVICPSDNQLCAPPSLSIAIHGHFHYPELFPDFLKRLAVNNLVCDVLLTTNSAESADQLGHAAEGYDNGAVSVHIVPNRGRDIGPFISELGQEIQRSYDIVGHIHGKRSLHTLAVDATYGDRWRVFLWEHLLGGRWPMADVIVGHFAENPSVGLVFPADPNLVGWDMSADAAVQLASRIGISASLPSAFDFPNGTMFWARTAALTPLFEAGLTFDDYPAELLPKDGTPLHALERMLPFIVEAAGYTIATTRVPGFHR